MTPEEEMLQLVKNAATEPLPWVNMRPWIGAPVPEQEWTVPERIPARQTTLFSGHGATGKSTLGLQLAAAHVLGRDWLQALPDIGPAMFVDAEDELSVMHRRLAHICSHYDSDFDELIRGGLYLLSLAGEDAVLGAPDRSGVIEGTELYARLLEAAGDIKPRTIVIASSANCFAGNENDRPQVTQFIGLMTRLAIRCGGSVVLIAHPSLTGMGNRSGISGSTQWHNGVRARIYLRPLKTDDKDEDEQPASDLRVIEFLKNQYGPLKQSVALHYQNGLFLPETSGSSLDRVARDAKADDFIADGLKQYHAVGNFPLSPKRNAENYAPTIIAKQPAFKESGLAKKDLEDALHRLLLNGTIAIEEYGPPSKRYQRLKLAEHE